MVVRQVTADAPPERPPIVSAVARFVAVVLVTAAVILAALRLLS